MTDSNDSTLNRTLYELGFLDKKGNPEKNKEKRWKMNCNEATLILQDALRDIRRIEDFVLSREEFQRHWLRVTREGGPYADGYDDALREIRNYIKALYETKRTPR